MKYTNLLNFIVILFFSSNSIKAQGIDIPRSSPKASVTQMVGVNNITVEYGRPAVKGRKIFGELVAYNNVWRAGANEATTISFEEDVTFEGMQVSKGKYALFMIPSEDAWTII